jgi:serine protease
MHGSTVPAVPTGSQNPGSQGMADRYTMNGVHIMLPRSAGHVTNPDLTGLLHYNGGPIEKYPKVFVVYWGFTTDPTGEKKYLHAFLSGLGGSAWMQTTHQYYETVRGHITNPTGQLKGEWKDLSNIPNQPSDFQIQQEAAKAVTHYGFDPDASYVVATAHNHNTPGFGTQFCAYHGAFSSGGNAIAYTNLPYITDAGQNCGENIVNPGPSGVNDGVSIVEGHEYAESQTDPQPISGWYGPQGEIGDICAWMNLQNTQLPTGSFATQPLYSDRKAACVQHTP